jgi:exodeoxyribonuclease VII small subunit
MPRLREGNPLPASSDQNSLFASQTLATASGAGTQAGTFELSLAELERIVHDLEEGGLGLAESLAQYEQAIKHLKHCYSVLNETEQRIQLVAKVLEDGTPTTQPFDDGLAGPSDSLAESAGKRRTRRTKSSGEGVD